MARLGGGNGLPVLDRGVEPLVGLGLLNRLLEVSRSGVHPSLRRECTLEPRKEPRSVLRAARCGAVPPGVCHHPEPALFARPHGQAVVENEAAVLGRVIKAADRNGLKLVVHAVSSVLAYGAVKIAFKYCECRCMASLTLLSCKSNEV